MKLLALDTATEACSAALLIDGRVTLDYEELGRGHADRVLPMIDALLAGASLNLQSLDAIAFGRGPGGFTGVRLATSLSQGLAFSAGKPVIPVSDLRAVARLAFDEYPGAERVLACNDARMGEVYWACFERRRAAGAAISGGSFTESGTVELVGVERVSAPEAVEVPETWRRFDILAGRGAALYATTLRRLPHSQEMNRLLPHAGAIARLAALDFLQGRTLAPREAMPVYLRDRVASPAPAPAAVCAGDTAAGDARSGGNPGAPGE